MIKLTPSSRRRLGKSGGGGGGGGGDSGGDSDGDIGDFGAESYAIVSQAAL